MEEGQLAEGQEPALHRSLTILIEKREAAGMVGKRKPWLSLLLSGNETVAMWVKGICSGATGFDLGHRQTCT